MELKVLNKLKPIGAMKKCTKSNCNLFMEERLTILKKLREEHVTVMKKEYGDIQGLPEKNGFP